MRERERARTGSQSSLVLHWIQLYFGGSPIARTASHTELAAAGGCRRVSIGFALSVGSCRKPIAPPPSTCMGKGGRDHVAADVQPRRP